MRASAMDRKQADELVHEIAGMIAQSEVRESDDWVSVSVVAIVDEASVQISSYRYDAEGRAEPGNPGDFSVNRKFRELNAAMQQPTGRQWKSALMQIRRATGEVTIDFEYDDASRWKVTPLNIDTMPQRLRPG
ncbi:hypothetical protein I3J27_13455 [Bradyrhizobium xenonodulans]|uniref:Uncharacterized protein n=1 Tax=Bradyrhizobium xenonodulans TaxID=2736875 RepID=A0ABY7MSM0_9BRAD|nr:hypothetical protein [Bradyrhizobium xenonodulans]WBL81375.1 hypothetical protein I3J27_13455 [Bradyrhizobium xenonodulans]